MKDIVCFCNYTYIMCMCASYSIVVGYIYIKMRSPLYTKVVVYFFPNQ